MDTVLGAWARRLNCIVTSRLLGSAAATADVLLTATQDNDSSVSASVAEAEQRS